MMADIALLVFYGLTFWILYRVKAPLDTGTKAELQAGFLPMDNNATLVRRYAPPLPRRLVELLASCPYEEPGRPANRRHALQLVHLGLLERDPSAPDWFRATDAGTEVLDRWRRLGWL